MSDELIALLSPLVIPAIVAILSSLTTLLITIIRYSNSAKRTDLDILREVNSVILKENKRLSNIILRMRTERDEDRKKTIELEKKIVDLEEKLKNGNCPVMNNNEKQWLE